MKRLLFILGLCSLFGCSSNEELPVVDRVDLERYQGRWYEISSITIRPQRNCKCTYAEYSLKNDYVEVYNHCIDKRDGSVSDISGKATAVPGSENAKLKVSFFPLIKSPYQIIALDQENYQYAMVGSPSRDYLWILCREKSMSQELYDSLLKKAESLGFDTERLSLTAQDC